MTEHTKRPVATTSVRPEGSLSTGFPFRLLPEEPPLLETVLLPKAPSLRLYVCHAHTPDSAPGNSVPTILMKCMLRGDPEAGEKETSSSSLRSLPCWQVGQRN